MGTLRQNQTKKTQATAQQQAASSNNRDIHPAEEIQEMFGNQALGRLIESQSLPPINQISTANNAAIQRRHLFRGLSHELTGNEQGNLVQAKLTVNQPGDKYEQEADRVASQVVQQINNPVSQLDQSETIQSKQLMRKSVSSPGTVTGGMAATPHLETAIKQEQGHGQSISEDIREPLEQSFGADFSGVRIHTNDQSDQLNRSIQSRAFTTGQDIFFKQGAYQPGSRQGKELIAHELTHVVQQNSTNTLQTKIQRTKEDQKPANVNFWVLDPETFQKKTKLHIGNVKRGKYLTTIDKWLESAKAGTWDKQQYALSQVVEACDAFLEHNFDTKMMGGLKEKDWNRNEEIRTEVQATQEKARNLLDFASMASDSKNSQATAPDMEDTSIVRGRVKEGVEGALGITDTTSGTAGGHDDIYGTELGDAVKSDYLDTGTNLVGGTLNTWNAGKELLSKESGVKDRINAGGSFVAGGGQILHSAGKGTKLIGGIAKGEEFKNLGSGFGEIGGAIGDSTAAFGGLISTATGIFDLCQNWTESTKKEKAAAALEIGGGMTATAQSGVKTASGVVKSVAAVTGKEAATETISKLGSAAAIIGIVVGSIQVAQGGFQFYRGLSSKMSAKKAEDEQNRIITEIGKGLQQAQAQLPALFDTGNRQEILEVVQKILTLRDTLVQLQKEQMQSAPAMEARKKIGNRRMEEGAMKAAGGTLGIVTGALVLSGVGAPIALAIGALSGLLALGYAGVKLGRNLTAKSLIDIAQRLSDDGQPKAIPDPKPDYRIMEERVYKCYYKHLPHVLTKVEPQGMDSSEFRKVKAFAWEDKKKRVDDSEKVIIDRPSQADQLDKMTKKNKWVEVQNSKRQTTHQEKPQGSEYIKYKLSPSAHKSKQSLNASKAELASILTLMCMQSYDPKTQQFINSPIKPMGEADAETLAEFGNITLKSLLSAADITEERWSRWFKNFGGDQVKLEEKVLAHIS